MLVQEVFNLLQYGELSQLSIGNSNAGVIAETDYPKLLAHLQLGLTKLHTRFNLKQESLEVPLISGTTEYAMPDDCLKVTLVRTSESKNLPLNELTNKYSVLTPQARRLVVPSDIVEQVDDVPEAYQTTSVTVTYRANHAKLVVDDFDIDETTIDLPDTHLEPLLYFIASRVHNPIGTLSPGQEGAVGINWSARYEQSCQDLELKGFQVNENLYSERFYEKGFV